MKRQGLEINEQLSWIERDSDEADLLDCKRIA